MNNSAPRTWAVTAKGHDYEVLVAPGQPWTPPPPDVWLPLEEVLTYSPSDEPTWSATVNWARTQHPQRYAALLDSVRLHGIRTPIELDPTRRRVERGHHRIVAAIDAPIAALPVRWGRRDEAWEWDHRSDTHLPYLYAPGDLDAEDA